MASRARGLDPDLDARLMETSRDLLARGPGAETSVAALRRMATFYRAHGWAERAQGYLDLGAEMGMSVVRDGRGLEEGAGVVEEAVPSGSGWGMLELQELRGLL